MRLLIAIAILLTPAIAGAQGKYYIPNKTTESITVDGKLESRDLTTYTEVSLKDKVLSKETADKEFSLDNICTTILATGQDEDRREYTYHRRVTLREWIALGKPKRVGPFTPYRVLLGHDPVMPSDEEILEMVNGLVSEPVLEK
jgi:hypothetical protein